MGCLQMSVRNYHYALRNSPEECSSLLILFFFYKNNRRRIQASKERNFADSRLMEMLLKGEVCVSYEATNKVEIWK
jgi:hypothetical protein